MVGTILTVLKPTKIPLLVSKGKGTKGDKAFRLLTMD
jgi:hypothetical protein